MPNRIKKLTLTGFRGSTQTAAIEFDGAKPITIIFGENGTGKSTIADAIDFIINKDFGSLKDRSLDARQKSSFVASHGGSPANVEVSLTIAQQSWSARMAKGKVARTGPEEVPRAWVLRRADIVQFTEASATSRYEKLKDFISAPNIETCETNLREALKTAKQAYDSASQSLEQALSQLTSIWEREGAPGGDAWAWAERLLSTPPDASRNRLAVLEATITAIKAARAAEAAFFEAEKAGDQARHALQTASEALDAAQTGEHANSAGLLTLLGNARALLTSPGPHEACPVCGQSITAIDTVIQIDQRMRTLDAIKDIAARKSQAASANERAGTLLADRRGELVARARAMVDACARAGVPLAGASSGQSELALLEEAGSHIAQLEREREQTQRAAAQYDHIRHAANLIEEKRADAQAHESLVARMTSVLGIVEHERKAYCDGMLRAIGGTINELYTRIHPDEPVGGYQLQMKASGKGSVETGARFGDEEGVQAGAYYSEAHLDTLGLCAYLALARHGASSDIIVLDDVLTSVDDAHLQRVMQTIHDEADHYGHMIITTHFRPWRDKYRLGAHDAGHVQLIELAPWSMESGIRPRKTLLTIEEVERYLHADEFDRQIVASKAGIMLEGLFDLLALRYACPMPRRANPDYTLNELFGAIKKIGRHLRVERLDAGGTGVGIDIAPLLSSLDEFAWIRNQVGAHFNPGGQLVSDADVKLFADHALALARALMCPACHAVPAKDNSGSYYECGCPAHRTRLSPRVIPG